MLLAAYRFSTPSSFSIRSTPSSVSIVELALEPRDQPVDLLVEIRRRLALCGDDERRARLVDQDRVDLVDHAVVQPALHHAIRRLLHVVAQVVEAELVVLAVCDVAVVVVLAGGIGEGGGAPAR